jgi:hypothetical protein
MTTAEPSSLEPSTHEPTTPQASHPEVTTNLRIIAGSPTPEELAAVTAVLAKALEEAAVDQQQPAVIRSAWDRSRAALRGPLTPGPGAWRAFSG